MGVIAEPVAEEAVAAVDTEIVDQDPSEGKVISEESCHFKR